MSELLGAAVIGLGVGEQHAKMFARTEGCTLRWVYDIDAAKMNAVRERVGAGMCATSFEQILNDPQTHIICVASYDHLHPDEVIAAFRAGKHVFCEKPLCRTHEELLAIQTAWRESAKELECNLVLRSAPFYRWLKDAIHAGELGRVYSIDGEYLYGRIHKITEGWRKDVDDYSIMLGGGVHLADLMMWMTGEKPNRVIARGNKLATIDTNFRYEDFVTTIFDFPSGMIGRITANFGGVHHHQHVVRVFGTKATVLYDDQGPRIFRSRDPEVPSEKISLSALPANKGDLIPGFIDRIRHHGANQKPTAHEFDVITACMAADRAAQTQQPMPIEYP